MKRRRFRKWKKHWYKGKQLHYTSAMISLPIIKKIAAEHGAVVSEELSSRKIDLFDFDITLLRKARYPCSYEQIK